jgi:hypothetical protein
MNFPCIPLLIKYYEESVRSNSQATSDILAGLEDNQGLEKESLIHYLR